MQITAPVTIELESVRVFTGAHSSFSCHLEISLKPYQTAVFLSQNNLILASSYDFNLTNTHTRSSHFLSLQPHSQAVPQPPASPDCVSPNVLGLPQLGFPGLFPVPAMAPPSSLWKFLSVKTPCLSLLQGALLWPFSSHSHTHTFMHTHRLHYTITKPLRWDLSCTAVSRL